MTCVVAEPPVLVCVVVPLCLSVLPDLLCCECYKCTNMLFQCWVRKCLSGPSDSIFLAIYFFLHLSRYLKAFKLQKKTRMLLEIMPNYACGRFWNDFTPLVHSQGDTTHSDITFKTFE